MKTVGCCLLAGIILFSCGHSEQKVKQLPLTDTVAAAVITHHLSARELAHYGNASQRFFDSVLPRNFNGSVLVAKNGEIVYERYSGFKNPRIHSDSINPHSAFHLASVSKTFTAMAVLQLWQEGKLQLGDEVSKWLPGFPFAGVTIRTLLNHRSGLFNYVHFMDKSGWDKRKFLTNADVLQYIIAHPHEVQAAPPNRHFEYSNTNYALLALIVEKASAVDFPTYLRTNFFEPIGMHDTYVFSIAQSGTAMNSYKRNGVPFRIEFLDGVYGDKNVYSTVRDMLAWDGYLRSGKFFTKATLDSAYMPYSFEKPGKRNYGLGWRMLLMPNGKKLIYHNGWWHGNRTAFIRMLDENATIIALCNNDVTRVYASKKLCDLFGNYQQGGEKFEEGENDPEGRGGDNTSKK